MKKKLTFIFILITLSMLGIVYFQIDLMRKTYNIHLSRISAISNKALVEALLATKNANRLLIHDTLNAHLKNYKGNGTGFIAGDTSTGDTLKITLQKKFNTNPIEGLTYSKGRISLNFADIPASTDQYTRATYDEKAKYIFDSLFVSSNGFCKPLYYKSDSIKIRTFFETALAKEGLMEFNNDIHLMFFCSPHLIKVPALPVPGTGIYQYEPVGLSHYITGEKKFVGVFFHQNPLLIIYRMVWLAILSAFLIIIIIGSYIYLLRIILKQKRLAEMKDDFINNMTHELKTPIAIVSAAVEGMQNFNALQDKEKTDRYLETSRKELNRLNDLVTKVLHMASYEKKDIQLSLDKIDVSEMIREVIESFKNHAEKELNITFNNSSSINYIHADPVHFRNAIANLIDNAIKYSGEVVEIKIICSIESNYMKFSFKDKGIGIPASQLNHIFEKFHRVPTGNVHNVKGTGLGLSYVKYIAEMHGGSVFVKSEVDKGSEFTISLPLR